MTIWRKLLLFNKDMKIWIRTMPSYSYETTMTTTSTSSSSSRAKSESRCSSVSSKVGFWQLEEMQEEQFQIQRQIWYQTASKTQLTFFSQKAGWGVLLWTEPLRWGEIAAGKVHGKVFLSDPSPIIGYACQWLTNWLTDCRLVNLSLIIDRSLVMLVSDWLTN